MKRLWIPSVLLSLNQFERSLFSVKLSDADPYFLSEINIIHFPSLHLYTYLYIVFHHCTLSLLLTLNAPPPRYLHSSLLSPSVSTLEPSRCPLSLSSHSCVAVLAEWQEDELGNLQQPGAGRRPGSPAVVPPEGAAAAGARRGGAASGLQAGGDSPGSPRGVPRFACRLRYGGATDHATQRTGDLLVINCTLMTMLPSQYANISCQPVPVLIGKFRWAQAGRWGLIWECRFPAKLPFPTKRLCANAG